MVFSKDKMLLLLLSRFSRVWLCATPYTAVHQAPPSLGFTRQEHWSGLPFPSPMHESEKWKRSRSVVSDSSRPHGLQPTRLLRPWDFPGTSTGVGCPCLLRHWFKSDIIKWVLAWKGGILGSNPACVIDPSCGLSVGLATGIGLWVQLTECNRPFSSVISGKLIQLSSQTCSVV